MPGKKEKRDVWGLDVAGEIGGKKNDCGKLTPKAHGGLVACQNGYHLSRSLKATRSGGDCRSLGEKPGEPTHEQGEKKRRSASRWGGDEL